MSNDLKLGLFVAAYILCGLAYAAFKFVQADRESLRIRGVPSNAHAPLQGVVGFTFWPFLIWIDLVKLLMKPPKRQVARPQLILIRSSRRDNSRR
jgi:hypothetical protein